MSFFYFITSDDFIKKRFDYIKSKYPKTGKKKNNFYHYSHIIQSKYLKNGILKKFFIITYNISHINREDQASGYESNVRTLYSRYCIVYTSKSVRFLNFYPSLFLTTLPNFSQPATTTWKGRNWVGQIAYKCFHLPEIPFTYIYRGIYHTFTIMYRIHT